MIHSPPSYIKYTIKHRQVITIAINFIFYSLGETAELQMSRKALLISQN